MIFRKSYLEDFREVFLYVFQSLLKYNVLEDFNKTSLMHITIMILKSLVLTILLIHSKKTSLMHITIMILKSLIKYFKKQVYYPLIAIIIIDAYLRDENKQ